MTAAEIDAIARAVAVQRTAGHRKVVIEAASVRRLIRLARRQVRQESRGARHDAGE